VSTLAEECLHLYVYVYVYVSVSVSLSIVSLWLQNSCTADDSRDVDAFTSSTPLCAACSQTRHRSRTLEKEVQQLQANLNCKTTELTGLQEEHHKLKLAHTTAVDELSVNKRLVEEWQRNYAQASMRVEEITTHLKENSGSVGV
jgi:Skp family chaperone for outer membrane proteins